jgi:hypothetical protein
MVAGVVLIATDVSAQNLIIVLRVGPTMASFGEPLNGNVTITLRSGTRITVPLSDIDLELTKSTQTFSRSTGKDDTESSSDATAQINAQCAKMFETNFTMQAACRTQQQDAYRALTARQMASGDRATIRRECLKMFPQNFTMRNACEQQQLDALKTLGRE